MVEQDEMASSCARGGLGWVLGKNVFLEKILKQLTKLSQGSGGILEVLNVVWICCLGHNLMVDLAVLG